MRKVQVLLSKLLTLLKAKVDRFGYPIVTMTAPKLGVNFKVDRNDPAFNRPLSELKAKTHALKI